MFPIYRNRVVDLQSKNQLSRFYMMGTLVVKGLMSKTYIPAGMKSRLVFAVRVPSFDVMGLKR